MKTILFIFISIIILGCSPSYYAPNSQNIPIMKTKGQTNLGIGYNESADTRGFEIQASHAITNHIALQFNSDWVENIYDSDDFQGKGKILEIGTGYFKDLSPNFTFETYGLLGFGTIEAETTTSSTNDFSAKFNRLGIQPSLSYSLKYFSFSLSTRIAHLKYRDISGGQNVTDFDPNYLKTNNSHWLLEPALTIQAGFENLKLQLQYVYSQNLTNPDFEQQVDIISLGLKLNLLPKKE